MTTPINGINTQVAEQLSQLIRDGASGLESQDNVTSSFKDLMIQSIDQVNSMQQNADLAVESWATGGDIDPAEVLTAVQKADMSFQMMQQIRNKLVDAFQELKEIRI